MSPSPPSEASTLRDTLPGVKNTLFRLSRKLDKKHLPVNQQQQSLLINRPPQEIREIIWQYILSGNRIELRQHGPITIWGQILKWRTIIQTDDDAFLDLWRPNLHNGTSLLKTCRLVLREAMDDLCSCNRFILTEESFWRASTKIMPYQFGRMRIMDFSKDFFRDDRKYWTQLCKAIAEMTSLRKLNMLLHETSKNYNDDREKDRRSGVRLLHKKVFGSPVPVSEEFILDSLYQIKQVKEFEVKLDDRRDDLAMPEVHSNAPFRLICEYRKDKEARLKKEEQEWHERELTEQQEAAEKRRLIKAQRQAERLRLELERKVQEIVESYPSFSG